MKLTAKANHDTVTIPIWGHGDELFEVTVRELTRSDILYLQKCSTTSKSVHGQVVQVPDQEEFTRLLIEHLIVDWRGLTPKLLVEFAPLRPESSEELNLPAQSDTDPMPCDHRTIVFRHMPEKPPGAPADWEAREEVYTLPRYLWERGPRAQFAEHIERVARNMAQVKRALREAEKKRQSSSRSPDTEDPPPSTASSAENGPAPDASDGTGAAA